MAYAAMNIDVFPILMFKIFLNGVCRHELGTKASTQGVYFLNGVCRHEHQVVGLFIDMLFLNGVCRHEL